MQRRLRPQIRYTGAPHLAPVCRAGPRPVRLTVTRYAYAPGHAYLSYADLLGIDELVLSGSPADGTEVAMPSPLCDAPAV